MLGYITRRSLTSRSVQPRGQSVRVTKRNCTSTPSEELGALPTPSEELGALPLPSTTESPGENTVNSAFTVGNVLGQLDPLRKLGIIFTCTVCQFRSAKTFSYQSYTQGVVIIRCPSCENNHLIADNLGWFRDTPVNVETMAEEKGQKVRRLTDVEELNAEQDVHGLENFKKVFAQTQELETAKASSE